MTDTLIRIDCSNKGNLLVNVSLSVALVMVQNNQPQDISDRLRHFYIVYECMGPSGSQVDLLMHLWSAAGRLGSSADLGWAAQVSWGWLAID